ncbi:MAG TPA: FAD-dependent oxidoreductase [Oscillospiraceae bacterium]|mgnify:CR=1 FL=1|nr:FAD-dependent oxidoreductase [Oscillospiraceae bacterium]HPF56875.1 FAD-dependent oxidoreductase [Clostridiales bacterium]HPK36320.1 FAD-dependent oxidoreductase [Oscillospiraceae bacterium]HPR76092.1 FAD-dependent oxidoreductase [Oscillospiraceae bacterium]
MHDIIIIGGGPAGLTAAIYARRANKSVLVLEKDGFGGQMTHSPKIENFPGFISISGNELADHMLDQAMALGADIEIEEALEITAEGDKKIIKTDFGTHEGSCIITAMGAKHRLLGVPGEDKFVGDGISFCAVCDGAFYAGKSVAVIGGGNSALQEAILLSELCTEVTIIQNLDFLTGEEKLQESVRCKANIKIILGTVIKEFFGENEFEGLVTHRDSDGHEETLRFNGAFVAIGLAPENGIVKDMTKLDQIGYIISDENCLTDDEGIFVAGDCRTKRIRQITTAAADGATAALAACRYLDRQKECAVKN